MEDTLLDQLKPIFPNLTEEVILISIQHPSNNTDPLSPQSVFMSCIDDLLQLRTFSLALAEPQKKQTLSSDDDDSLMKAAEKVEKEFSSSTESKQKATDTKNQPQQFTNTKVSDTSLKQPPSTSAQPKQLTNTKELDTRLKQHPSTSAVCNSGNLSSLSYQTAKKDAIDSEDSSNDSLPDPCFGTKKSQRDPSITTKNSKSGFTSSASAHIHDPSSQAWSSSPLPLHKRKWKFQTGSHSAEVSSKDIEGQRTRFHSEPSEPIFSLNKAVNIKGSLIKPATFSPTKSTDGTVMSGLKKGTLIKPAVFSGSPNRSNNSVSTDTKIPTTHFVQGNNQHLLYDEKNNKQPKCITKNSLIKPAHFLPKPAPSCSVNIPSSTTDKCSVNLPSDSQATSLSSNTSKCNSSGDTNANYKITPTSVSKVLNKDEGPDFPSTSKILETNRPAGLENWRYVCVQTDNGLLDDEQIYRNEILSKSGEVMGKIQDERRKSLVGINTQKNNVKESTPGTSTKIVLNDLVKTSTAQAKSVHASVELKKTSTVGASSKPDNKVPENAVAGTSSKATFTLSTQGARSTVSTLNNPKKMSKINADKGENKREDGVYNDSIDKDDEDLPKFDFLTTARRQTDVSKVQSLNVKRTLVTDNLAGPSTSKNNSGEMLKGRQRVRTKDEDLIIVGQKTDRSLDVIDMTGSSQSSVGSQDEAVINVEALPDVVDITEEPVDVVPDVFEINPSNEKVEPKKVIHLDHEPVKVAKPVNQIREKTLASETVSLLNRNTVPQATRPATQAQQLPAATNAAVPRKPIPATNLPPLPNMEKSPEEKLSDMVNEVLMMFPDVDPLYVKNLLLRYIGPEALNNVCNLLLENANYPRVQRGTTSTVSSEPPPKKKSYKNFYEDFSEPVTDFIYKNNCELLLQSEFKMISVKDIRILASHFNWHYAPMHKALTLIVKKGMEDKEDKGKLSLSQAVIVCDIPVGSEKKPMKATCLKCPRAVKCSLSSLPPELSEEYEFVKERILEEAKDEDMKIAQQMNECEYTELGQLIECGCCFCEVAFDNMVQCYEGHLFCEDCLKNYANESVFGHGKTSLLCMSDGCDASFPKSQLDKALPANILDKYNDRVQEESINLAALDDLVRCPHCDFAALLDPSVKVFACQNTSCMKETCRHCKEDWKEHFGKRCDEIEKKDEVSLRIKFEEKMAMAKIRICHRCKAKFMKEEGCNKMTCKCGATMCYVCRKPDIDYKHFCQHLREPKKPCNKCTDCFLWSKAEEDDERAIAEIRKECEALRVEKGYSLEKFIGAPEEPPNKKMKVK